MEWAIPVMFSNAPSGTLYSLWEVSEQPPVELVAPSPVVKKRIDARGFKGQLIAGSVGRDANSTFNSKE
jgi:hypothetical protein